MAVLTVQNITIDGLEVSYSSAASGGDTAANNGRMFLEIVNAGASARTVTVASQKACNQGYTHDESVSVPASETRKMGPFLTNRFNNSDSAIEISYDAVTSLTVAAISLGE